MPDNPVHDDNIASADDLTRIAGIGAKTAERLNAAGIWNYADLASRSAGDIAVLLSDIAGLSPARLDGWRDQARELAGTAGVAGAEPGQALVEGPAPDGSALQASGDAPSDGQHYESFVVRVLLNEDGSIRRTTVQHVGTGAERHWPGLAREALPDFIEAAAAPAARSTHVPAEQRSDTAGRPAAGSTAMSSRPGELQPASVPSVPSGPAEARYVPLAPSVGLSLERTMVRAAEPLTMTMTIDLAGAAADADRFAYSAIIVARPVAGGPKRTLVQADGLFATRSPTISIDATGLPAGAYRLDAAVTLREPRGGRPLGLAALAEGLLVQVLPG